MGGFFVELGCGVCIVMLLVGQELGNCWWL